MEEFMRLIRLYFIKNRKGTKGMKRIFIAASVFLLISMLGAHALAAYAPVGVGEKERYNINLFLSNFSEQGMMFYSSGRVNDETLVNFALDHIWLNRQDLVERADFGAHNFRIADDRIEGIALKYFGVAPESYASSRYAYHDGFFYGESTGGYMGNGVVSLSHVEDMGGGVYGVYFGCYGEGEFFAADDCYLRPEQAAVRFAGSAVHTGYAMIDTHAAGLLSREGWTLMQYDVLN